MSNTLHFVSECHILDVLYMIHERLREKKPLLWAAYRKHVNFHQDMNFKEHQPGKTCTYRGYSHTVDKPRMGLKNKPVIALQQWRPPCLIFSTLTQADHSSKPEFKAKMATVRMSGLGHTKTLKHCGSSVQPVYSILPDFSNRNYLILHEDYTNLDSTETKIKFLCKNIQLPSEVFVSMSSRPWLASPEQLVTVDTNETSTVNTWIKKIGSPHHLRNATSNI